MKFLSHFRFYLVYYMTNHVMAHVPWHALRLFWYRKVVGMQIGEGSHVFLGQSFYGNCIDCIRIGKKTTINPGCFFNASDDIVIGDRVVLAHKVSLHTADHDIHAETFPMRVGPIRIEDDAWIASHAIILKGVRIGRGAVVAAGAVVTKSVKEYEVVAGSPAKCIGMRKATSANLAAEDHPLFC